MSRNRSKWQFIVNTNTYKHHGFRSGRAHPHGQAKRLQLSSHEPSHHLTLVVHGFPLPGLMWLYNKIFASSSKWNLLLYSALVRLLVIYRCGVDHGCMKAKIRNKNLFCTTSTLTRFSALNSRSDIVDGLYLWRASADKIPSALILDLND